MCLVPLHLLLPGTPCQAGPIGAHLRSFCHAHHAQDPTALTACPDHKSSTVSRIKDKHSLVCPSKSTTSV